MIIGLKEGEGTTREVISGLKEGEGSHFRVTTPGRGTRGDSTYPRHTTVG